jgi:hypothetical protein
LLESANDRGISVLGVFELYKSINLELMVEKPKKREKHV